MSDEQFLARWSRRKQVAAGHAEPASEKSAEAVGSATSEPAAAEWGAPEMELSNLPPIGSIDAATDVTAFLRQGIPEELCRAALRRAWSADPAIRDFVGLAENAWDFNDPNAMAGFGPLDYSAEQVDALVRRIVGGVVEAAETVPDAPVELAEDAARSASADARAAQSPDLAKAITKPRLLDESAARELPTNSAASQPVATSDANAASDATEEPPLPRRTHGGALPR